MTLNGTFVAEGVEYEVFDIDGDVVTLDRPYEGSVVTDGDVDVPLFAPTSTAFYTQSALEDEVAAGDVVFVENALGGLDEVVVESDPAGKRLAWHGCQLDSI